MKEMGEPSGRAIPADVFLAARKRRPASERSCGPAKIVQGDFAPRPRGAGSGEEGAGASLPERWRAVQTLRERLAALPPVRDEKIRQVRARILAGFYDTPEVLEEIARRILEEAPAGERGPSPCAS